MLAVLTVTYMVIGIAVYLAAMAWGLWALRPATIRRSHMFRAAFGAYLLLAFLFPVVATPQYLVGLVALPNMQSAALTMPWIAAAVFAPAQARWLHHAVVNEAENRRRLLAGSATAADVAYKFEINGELRTVSTTIHCFDRALSELEIVQLHYFPNFPTAVADDFVFEVSPHQFITARNGHQVCSAIKARRPSGAPVTFSSVQSLHVFYVDRNKAPVQVVDFRLSEKPLFCGDITIHPPEIVNVRTVRAKDVIKPRDLSWFRHAVENGAQEPEVIGDLRSQTGAKPTKSWRCPPSKPTYGSSSVSQ